LIHVVYLLYIAKKLIALHSIIFFYPDSEQGKVIRTGLVMWWNFYHSICSEWKFFKN